MVIVKIGGSLFNSPNLQSLLDKIATIENKQIIIVPGGGPFADQVRQASNMWNIPEATAHPMAVMAMQQFAHLLFSLNGNIETLSSYNEVSSNLSTPGIRIWMPYMDVTQDCNYPGNWNTTSDSLAVWLASKLSADKLIIVKSANVQNKTYQQIVSSPVVDGYFIHALKEYSGTVKFFHASQLDQIVSAINNE